ncbi:MAG: ATP-binding cassette domain-containing protein [Ruminococcus sp.]|uniref:ABC transporter ATP-binding protein n=1 Tax=Ruminococcus sp. TaxID=41978 RepID=UPI0025DD29EF|nr:ATP-binding cassette domain-containing protein [Ruminococcus sp.]MBR5684035.1 ATP-binding cassette domain-containing protein [Ruminococcus sp.]
MIEVRNLTKKYGDKVAVRNISFKVEKGEILGFLGPNGAGKSTTMNMLTGYISSTSGEVLIDGTDILEDPRKAKANIGYLPEIPPLYVDMTVEAYLSFIYDLKKCKLPRSAHIKDVCSLCKIEDVKHRIIKNLSKGYRQRVGLAQALINNPPVLILDEPTVGLDPNQIIEIRSLIKKLGKRHTVILSSHILPEIQAVCDRIIIINKGEVAADGTADEIANNITNEHKMTLRIEGPTHTADDKRLITDAIKGIQGVKYIRADMEREKGIYDYDVETDGQTDVRREINRVCSENGWNILMLQLSDLTLEDIFLKITMDEGIGSKNDKKKKAASPKIGLKVDDKGRLNAVKEGEEEEKEEAEPEKAAENEENNGGEE